MPEQAALGVVAAVAQLPAEGEPWGHGGWLPPEEREALDWYTLGVLMGWRVEAGAGLAAWSAGRNALVVACDPELVPRSELDVLEARLHQEPLLVVSRPARQDHPLAQLAGVSHGQTSTAGGPLVWVGPGGRHEWQVRSAIAIDGLTASSDARTWATLDGAAVIVVRSVGQGLIATLGFEPSSARDSAGAITALLRRVLTHGSLRPVAWLDFDRTLVLRMDDPGGAQNVYNRGWCYEPLGHTAWDKIGSDLRRRRARLSIGYTAGWIDDGDPERGRLSVDGRPVVPRQAGAVHPAPLVQYDDIAGHAPGRVNDYRDEFRGIQALRSAGCAEVELHGWTHMHPDAASWAVSPDRYDAMSWYRELGSRAQPVIDACPPGDDPLAAGARAIERLFGIRPTTLIPPGDEFSDATVRRAFDLGLSLVASYYLALRAGERFCWCQHVCAPYLDQPDGAWFDAGLPVVGYFHDYEPAVHGVGWMTEALDAWQGAGADRLLDFRELAAAVGRQLSVEETASGLVLRVVGGDAPPLVRPLRVRVRTGDTGGARALAVEHDDADAVIDLADDGDGTAIAEIPV